MSNVIFEIEDHIGFAPEGYTELDACKYFALVIGWANMRELISEKFKELDVFNNAMKKLVNGEMNPVEFIVETLDGKLYEEYFKPEIREFIADYVTTGVLYDQLIKHFEVASVYAIPNDWSSLSSFFDVFDKHYIMVKDNYDERNNIGHP